MQSENQYRQLQQHYSYLINQGVLKAGDKLPSEREIGENFSLTRITVRQALQMLEADGMIYRMNRRGWFVTPPALRYNPSRWQSFMEYASHQGFLPYTEVMNQSIIQADSRLAKLFESDKGLKLLHLHRRRSVDGRPVLIEHIYINIKLLPDIENEDLSQSLTNLLKKKYGETYHDMNLAFKSTALPASAAEDLGITAGIPGMHIERTNYRRDGEVMEVDFEYWRHDAVIVELNMKGDLASPVKN
jgi:phosphonate utilization transcriptional regulator PhnR